MNDATVKLRVSGDYACFTRPETKVERLSYDVPTPSAARGILDAILWRPEMRWHIVKIAVLKPIRFQALKRNEVQSKLPVKGKTGVKAWMENPSAYRPQAAGAGSDDATPRNTLALRDVAYLIEAEPVVFDCGSSSDPNTPRKYKEMFDRRVLKGQCFHTPALGCREFAAAFEMPHEGEKPIEESRDLGMMLYDIVFGPSGEANRPIFFRARLESGILNTRAEDTFTDEALCREVLTCSFKR
jgi:CRISPR-associated protein Cas5d